MRYKLNKANWTEHRLRAAMLGVDGWITMADLRARTKWPGQIDLLTVINILVAAGEMETTRPWSRGSFSVRMAVRP